MFSLKKSIYKTRRDPSCECVDGDIVIGNQIWSCRNLDVTTFRNGEVIPQITDPVAWYTATTPAWCYYNNDPANGAIYGKLYNWHAVRDPRGLAPNGYHIPTKDEWTVLTDYLGGLSVAGGKMKEAGTTKWISPNIDATNSSCFTGLPGGDRQLNGSSGQLGTWGYFWSSTEQNTDTAWAIYLRNYEGTAEIANDSKTFGFSVRLLKEDVPLEPFDYMIITYQYNPPPGADYDLDTLSTFRYANSGPITGASMSQTAGFIPGTGTAGCGGNPCNTDNTRMPVGSTINTAYMVYGGDDVNQSLDGTFGESIVVNFKNLKDANITTSNEIVVELYAAWQSGTTGPYPITLKYETFIGGTVSQQVIGGVTTKRYVSNGISVSGPQVSPNKQLTAGGCGSGVDGPLNNYKQHVASISYNLVTKVASALFH